MDEAVNKPMIFKKNRLSIKRRIISPPIAQIELQGKNISPKVMESKIESM